MTDAPSLDTDEFFEAWLFKKETADFISAGRFFKTENGYEVKFNSFNDYSDYNHVLITQEKFEDEQPEKHILEGEFSS